MNKTILTIPCHWDKKVIKDIVDLEKSKNLEIKNIYGCLASAPILHGRSSSSVANISKKDAETFREYIRSLGLKFIYLLNAPFCFTSDLQKEKVEKYVDWVVNDFKADALTITSHELMKFIRQKHPDIPIHISTIANVKTWQDLKFFLDINPTRVVLHHDTNRDFKDLKKAVDFAKKANIDIELMLTESCLRRCSNRMLHYKYLSRGNLDLSFHTTCNTKKLLYPREILKANIIRPEDIDFYENLGVKIFKITGRSKPASWLLEVVKAYLNRSYDGNLIRLLGIDPMIKAEDWIYINNKSLAGFIKKFPTTGNESDENKYCDRWIIDLYKTGNFKINDGSKYYINSDKILICKLPGMFVSSILKREKLPN